MRVLYINPTGCVIDFTEGENSVESFSVSLCRFIPDAMKRSLGSNSSGNSGINKKTRKNNPSNQKTLGAAWGAASSRSSFRSSPFSDFGRSSLILWEFRGLFLVLGSV